VPTASFRHPALPLAGLCAEVRPGDADQGCVGGRKTPRSRPAGNSGGDALARGRASTRRSGTRRLAEPRPWRQVRQVRSRQARQGDRCVAQTVLGAPGCEHHITCAHALWRSDRRDQPGFTSYHEVDAGAAEPGAPPPPSPRSPHRMSLRTATSQSLDDPVEYVHRSRVRDLTARRPRLCASSRTARPATDLSADRALGGMAS